MSDRCMGSLHVRLDLSCKVWLHLGTGLFAHKEVVQQSKRQQIHHCGIHSLHQVPTSEPLCSGHEEDNWWKYNEMERKLHEHAFPEL